MKEATTDLVTAYPISLGPPCVNRPIEQDTIEIVIANKNDLIIPAKISERVTT